MTTDLDKLERLLKEATQGAWKHIAMGGGSTVLAPTEARRYDPEKGYCIAYPFLYGDENGKA